MYGIPTSSLLSLPNRKMIRNPQHFRQPPNTELCTANGAGIHRYIPEQGPTKECGSAHICGGCSTSVVWNLGPNTLYLVGACYTQVAPTAFHQPAHLLSLHCGLTRNMHCDSLRLEIILKSLRTTTLAPRPKMTPLVLALSHRMKSLALACTHRRMSKLRFRRQQAATRPTMASPLGL